MRGGSNADSLSMLRYCGLFNGDEGPELLPPWVVDVCWHRKPAPEELCGERRLAFILVRCRHELELQNLAQPRCVALKITRIRQLAGYLVRTFADFDWTSPEPRKPARPALGGWIGKLFRRGGGGDSSRGNRGPRWSDRRSPERSSGSRIRSNSATGIEGGSASGSGHRRSSNSRGVSPGSVGILDDDVGSAAPRGSRRSGSRNSRNLETQKDLIPGHR